MTTRLYCRECGWHPTFRRKRTALRAAARHHCAATPVAETTRPWWTRLWTTLWTGRPGDATEVGDNPADNSATGADELRDAHGNRIQWAVLAAHHAETTRRSRQAMVELVRAGYQIGPPPYGYRALRIRVTDPTGHSKLRAVLVPDWRTAAVVRQIFSWRVDDGLKFTTIARRLNSDPRQYPAPASTAQWTSQAVQRIVTNVKYAGRQVWARTAAGRPMPIERWVMSRPMVHEPLVDERTFHRAQRKAAGGHDDLAA